ncbi:hypothetical protein [Synechococcus phage DSL-LC02]|nr:hypothetical protein [Synechococcus phage DSL-LC02]
MYTLILFGADHQLATQWWNEVRKYDTKKQAERAAMNAMPIGGTLGYVIIHEFGETSWAVVDELMPSNASVSCKDNQFQVQPAPKLQFV